MVSKIKKRKNNRLVSTGKHIFGIAIVGLACFLTFQLFSFFSNPRITDTWGCAEGHKQLTNQSPQITAYINNLSILDKPILDKSDLKPNSNCNLDVPPSIQANKTYKLPNPSAGTLFDRIEATLKEKGFESDYEADYLPNLCGNGGKDSYSGTVWPRLVRYNLPPYSILIEFHCGAETQRRTGNDTTWRSLPVYEIRIHFEIRSL